MITAELRRAILAVAGPDQDPLLRPGPEPGSYTSSLPFRLEPGTRAGPRRPPGRPSPGSRPPTSPAPATSPSPSPTTPWPASRSGSRGPARPAPPATRCAAAPCPAPRASDLTAAPDWPSARAALAAEVTARLARTAGATLTFYPERPVLPPPAPPPRSPRRSPTRGSTRCGSRWPGCRRAASRRERRSSRGMSWAIPLMLFGTRMPPLPPCCAGPPTLASTGQAGSGRACSWHPRSWRCSTRCPGSRNGWPWPRAAAGPTSSPGTWRSWQRGRLTP